MIATLRLPAGGRNRDEAEKPFWISYSDLMTALMVLFLVVMSVSLLTITQELLEKQSHLDKQRKELEEKNSFLVKQRRALERTNSKLQEQQRELELAKQLMDTLKFERRSRSETINLVMGQLKQASATEEFQGKVSIAADRLVIDFGAAARFSSGDYRLASEGSRLLRAFVPKVLDAINSPGTDRWFKRVVVEGFTDTDGSYLYNLDLSLRRAQTGQSHENLIKFQ